MTTKLDQLLISIHPSRTIEEVDHLTDAAINSFPLGRAQMIDWQEFHLYLSQFTKHVENAVLRIEPKCHEVDDLNVYWGRCCHILLREYGPNGEKAAFEMARTGNDGGLYAVLKRICRSIAQEFTDNEIRAKVQQYWGELSIEEWRKAADEYLDKYGHLLPSELTEGSAARVRANLPKVLQEHPKMLQRLRGVGRL